ncbi:T9SS type B sorting domain-containing protein [Mucilaginibacter myungsuensis]|uniref:Gliding motility-associated C-terminal domain-containing protein n=1 Tax=Mucilaginibacter myungsuensis TaxID=649104 RepID=A0A929KY28_9SPHI|nr:gliding motility-associated C-terminal domain-containing protein [Mucilaginibacter myungsuensis]MBE9662033.1 gliding motility-associated C-terminal domain-containing protein [Mucilaginibacter myungsuensis]MDN3599534.1 gliding motility-associated C-terminal domain-containing protein [Mucilaginibacter myungsuensis]
MTSICTFGYLKVKHTALIALVLLCLTLPDLKVNAQNQTVANGAMTQPIDFPAANCTYNWLSDNPTIGLAARGSGNIAAFKAINNGFAPAIANITATILATPTYGYRTTTKTPRTIAVVDLKTHQDVAEITIPNGQILRMSPDGQILYMKDPTKPNMILLVSTITNDIVDQITLSAPYSWLMLSPGGDKIYLQNSVFSGANYDKLLVVDVATRTEEAPIVLSRDLFNPDLNVDPRFSFSKDGSKIYMTNDWGTFSNQGLLAIFDRSSKQMLTRVQVKRPTHVIESKDQTKLIITSATQTIPIQFYDIATGNVQETPFNQFTYFTVLSEDGNYLYTASYDHLIKIDLRNNSVTPFETGFSPISGIQILPNKDHTRIFVLERATGNVIMIDANDGTIRGDKINVNASKSYGNPDIDFSNSNMQLSPDGTQLYITNRVEDYANNKRFAYISVADVATQKVVKRIDLPNYEAQDIRLYDIEKYCSASTITVKITVDPDPPTITPSNNTLAAHNTTYGTPSTAGTFTISGQRINAGILVTPPAGFEISTNGTTFTNTTTVGGSGDVAATTVYIRLAATANAGNLYGGNIMISNGNLSLTKAIPTSSVAPAALELKATNVTKKYGETLTGGPGSTAFTAAGLKNNETIGSVTVTYGTGAATRDEVRSHTGSVKIDQPTGGTFLAGNYQIDRSDADIIVEQATLTVTADDKQRYYNEADPIFTFKYSGFVDPDDESVLTGTPNAFTTATKASPVGKYPINITGGAALNYKIEGKAGTLTIISRSVTPANAFTPNGDGINDTWNIANINQYPKATVQVYTRSGSQVFYALGYHTPWDATSNSGVLPTGTYYYVIDLGNGTDPMKGSLLVIR